ncbi:hypothetical protein OG285_00115 [Streptomyces sp. NBC_01471]|uniref:hypothetical protein n=1 Tax=Streptomyces sp. NBC_01471 TaxID=2903879 RepID=UPI003248CB15
MGGGQECGNRREFGAGHGGDLVDAQQQLVVEEECVLDGGEHATTAVGDSAGVLSPRPGGGVPFADNGGPVVGNEVEEVRYG